MNIAFEDNGDPWCFANESTDVDEGDDTVTGFVSTTLPRDSNYRVCSILCYYGVFKDV